MPEPSSAPKILIVDDDADSADALALLFSMQGFDASVARGGLAGVGAADDGKPDAIITDIHMPSIDGHALAKSIRMERSLSDRPVLVAYSGLDASDPRRADYRAAFDLWFTKPADMHALVAAVRDLLRSRGASAGSSGLPVESLQ